MLFSPRSCLCLGTVFVLCVSVFVVAEEAETREHAIELPEQDFIQVDLEELLNVVVSATKTEQRVEKAPSIVTVFTGEEIRDWGYNSISELLQHVVGFYVLDDHIVPNAIVRGVHAGQNGDSGHIKVMIDGHTISMRLSGGTWLGVELVPLTAVKRVEIIRGPASALYGANAFLGVVNIVTKNGADIDGASADFQAGFTGNNLGGGADFTFGTQKQGFDILLSARLNQRDLSGLELPGTSPASNLPWWQRKRNKKASNLDQVSGVGLLKLTYNFDEKNRLNITGYLTSIDRGAEFAPLMQLSHGLDPKGRQWDTRVSMMHGFVDANLVLSVNDSLDFTFDAMYFRGGPTDKDRFETGENRFYVKRDFLFQGGEFYFDTKWDILSSLTLVAGAELIYDNEQLPVNQYVIRETGEIANDLSNPRLTKEFVNPGAFIQATWSPIELLSLTGGIRYDWHNMYKSKFSGRAGLVVNPADKLNIKVLYGSAFKAPAPLLLFVQPACAGDILGNENLDAQYVHTVEAQILYSPWKFFDARTGIAYSFIQDKTNFVKEQINLVAYNIIDIGGISWESEIAAHYKDWVRGYANLSFQHLFFDESDKHQGYAQQLYGLNMNVTPPWVINAGVLGQIPHTPLKLSVNASYVSSRRASATNILENGKIYELDPYVMLDAYVALVDQKFIPDKETFVRVYFRNLLGVEGPDPGLSGFDYPLAPRTIMLQWIQEL